MTTGVGLHIAPSMLTVAVVGDGAEPTFLQREPILHLSPDGNATLGATPPSGPAQTITGFVSTVGEPEGIQVDDGAGFRGEDLLATALFCLIEASADYLEGPTEFYAAHPAWWSAPEIRAVREALNYLGLRSVVLLPEDTSPEVLDNAQAAARAAQTALAAAQCLAEGAAPHMTAEAAADTTVIPAITDPGPPVQAWSAIPATETPIRSNHSANPSRAAVELPTAGAGGEATGPARRRKLPGGPASVLAAAVLGFLIGGGGVAAILHTSVSDPRPAAGTAISDNLPAAQSVPQQTTPSPTAPPPTTKLSRPVPTSGFAPPTYAARQTPPAATTTTTPTPPPPSSTTAPTTTRHGPQPVDPNPGWDSPPTLEPPGSDSGDYPDSGSHANSYPYGQSGQFWPYPPGLDLPNSGSHGEKHSRPVP